MYLWYYGYMTTKSITPGTSNHVSYGGTSITGGVADVTVTDKNSTQQTFKASINVFNDHASVDIPGSYLGSSALPVTATVDFGGGKTATVTFVSGQSNAPSGGLQVSGTPVFSYGADFDTPGAINNVSNTLVFGANPVKWSNTDPDILTVESGDAPDVLTARVSGLYNLSGYFMVNGPTDPNTLVHIYAKITAVGGGPSIIMPYHATLQQFGTTAVLLQIGVKYQISVTVPGGLSVTPNYFAMELAPLASM